MAEGRDYDYPLWLNYVRQVILPRLHRLRKFHGLHIASAFRDLLAEAEQVEERAWQRMMEAPVWEPFDDAAACAEKATEEGLEHLRQMHYLHSRINGAICVAIWSEVERFLVLLLRHGVCGWDDSDAQKKEWRWHEIMCKYTKAGLALEELTGFEETDLLRLVNNAYKHGPGRSMNELRKRLSRPDEEMLPAGSDCGTGLAVDGRNISIPDAFVELSLEHAEALISALADRLRTSQS